MSIPIQVKRLRNAVEELKKKEKRKLLRALGVDKLVKRAFEEGWRMAHDSDKYLVLELDGKMSCIEELDELISKTRCWRSVDEAFANSDVEEEV